MGLSKTKLLKIWHRREELREQIADLAETKDKLDQRIIGELQREGINSITIQGEPIVMTEQETVEYDYDGLMQDLSRTGKGRKILKRITYRAIDKKALVAEIQAGNIPRKMILRRSSMKAKKPYLQPGSRRSHKDEE